MMKRPGLLGLTLIVVISLLLAVIAYLEGGNLLEIVGALLLPLVIYGLLFVVLLLVARR
jgi:hypothetical protein